MLLLVASLVVVASMVDGVAIGVGYGHSVGYSSQSIVSHAAPVAVAHHAPIAVAHHAPIAVAHHAPIAVAHHAPIAVAHAPVIAHAPAKHVVDYVDAHPAYKFEYSVHDGHTGDVKTQSESRDGDVVHGSYSLVEPDGTKRIVEYTADDHNGFNAVVHREHNTHPQVVHKVAVAAPIAYKHY